MLLEFVDLWSELFDTNALCMFWSRIYIKKVRKFPSYAVDLSLDKKSVRMEMDKAFHELREQGLDAWGQER